MSDAEVLLLIAAGLLGAGGLFLLILAWIEPSQLMIAHYRLIRGRTDETDRREYPASSDALGNFPAHDPSAGPRLLFFSDYHAGMMRVHLPVFINSILALKPDVVVFGGDLATGRRDMSKALRHLQLIGSALLAENIPFYGVWGNHDSFLTREDAEERGIRMLRNQSVVFRGPDGKDWLLTGLDDERTGRPDLDAALDQLIPKERAALLKTRAAEIPPSRSLIVAHNPDTGTSLPAMQAAWVFSGHYHGGQINLPFKLGYRSLRTDHAWRKNILRGLNRVKDFSLFISRGVGCVSLPLRLWSKPELAVFDLVSNAERSGAIRR